MSSHHDFAPLTCPSIRPFPQTSSPISHHTAPSGARTSSLSYRVSSPTCAALHIRCPSARVSPSKSAEGDVSAFTGREDFTTTAPGGSTVSWGGVGGGTDECQGIGAEV